MISGPQMSIFDLRRFEPIEWFLFFVVLLGLDLLGIFFKQKKEFLAVLFCL